MKNQAISIISTRHIDDKDIPCKFLIGTREYQIIDFGRRSETAEGFTILAQLDDNNVVELFFDYSSMQWIIKQNFLHRKMI
jgi:hypothetical protein